MEGISQYQRPGAILVPKARNPWEELAPNLINQVVGGAIMAKIRGNLDKEQLERQAEIELAKQGYIPSGPDVATQQSQPGILDKLKGLIGLGPSEAMAAQQGSTVNTANPGASTGVRVGGKVWQPGPIRADEVEIAGKKVGVIRHPSGNYSVVDPTSHQPTMDSIAATVALSRIKNGENPVTVLNELRKPSGENKWLPTYDKTTGKLVYGNPNTGEKWGEVPEKQFAVGIGPNGEIITIPTTAPRREGQNQPQGGGTDGGGNRVIVTDMPEGSSDKGAPRMSNELMDSIEKLKTLQTDYNTVKQQWDHPERKEVVKGWIGPAAGRGLETLDNLGILNNEDRNLFRANVEGMKNQLVYLRSGKQINEQEYKRLLKELPGMNDPPAVFGSKMTKFDAELNTILGTKMELIKKGGYRGADAINQTIKNDPIGLQGKPKPTSDPSVALQGKPAGVYKSKSGATVKWDGEKIIP